MVLISSKKKQAESQGLELEKNKRAKHGIVPRNNMKVMTSIEVRFMSFQ